MRSSTTSDPSRWPVSPPSRPTVSPTVTPIALEVEGTTLWVCGAGEAVLRTRKIRNITAGHRQLALLVDDLPSFEPFVARGIRIYGRADDPVERVGMVRPGYYVRVTPDDLVELEP